MPLEASQPRPHIARSVAFIGRQADAVSERAAATCAAANMHAAAQILMPPLR